MALDRGILPRPARIEQKKRGFLLNARHLRRRDTSCAWHHNSPMQSVIEFTMLE